MFQKDKMNQNRTAGTVLYGSNEVTMLFHSHSYYDKKQTEKELLSVFHS
ncbi:hypothetical protein QNH39_02210 [Neobacillus novalis]|uniref:Uncharacterized protein n=1 Tax=Neobacillus novalis TaxID=220687 RepID=A0AA95S989_9BACI|nr:hypothetical protein [Neobacillus novalis]WHY86715.1 hypothetical protein QNH39_02210 [Neobacillus novalis]